MADRGGIAQVAAAAGVAAGTGAAQLGLGYGLGVVVWPVAGTADDSVWLGSLGWATWIAASATVFGAVAAARLRSAAATAAPPSPVPPHGSSAVSRPGSPASGSRSPGGPWRFTLATAAAVGALLTVVLIALPAKDAGPRSDTFSPQVIAGGYALVGVLIGLLIAYWAVVSRPVAANLMATAAWLWALAAAAVVVDLTLHRSSAMYLTSWQFADVGDSARLGAIYWPSALLTLLAAVVIGAVAVLPSVRRGDFGVGSATAGAVGPLLVAAAFALLAPHLTAALGPLESAYLVAPYAVLAGLAGSALAVSVGRRVTARQTGRRAPREPRAARGRLWRGAAASDEEPGTATGRAQLPSTTPETSASTAGRATGRAASATAWATARRRPELAAPTVETATSTAARPPSTNKSATTAGSKKRRGASVSPAAVSPAPPTPAPPTPAPAARKAPASASTTPAPTPAAAKAPAPPVPRKPDARSTVAAPPTSPPVAKINPTRPGEPAGAPPPSKGATAEAAGAPATETLWVDDSDTAPAAPKRRFGRRSGPTDEPG